jgi:hypothetical protein
MRNLIAIAVVAVGVTDRDTALRYCNDRSIARWSYHGTPYDKEQQRGFVYRACMFDQRQPP